MASPGEKDVTVGFGAVLPALGIELREKWVRTEGSSFCLPLSPKGSLAYTPLEPGTVP